MQFLRTLVVLTLAITSTVTFGATPARSDPVLVRYVIDGDTIDVATVGRVRLLGIDAPELGRGYDTAAPFAYEAREKLISLVLHRWVRLEPDGRRLDVYNRHLAYVLREDGVFVNAEMVREGLARVSARQPLSRLADLKRAEEEAQSFRHGIWGGTPPVHAPSYTTRPDSKSKGAGARGRHPRRIRVAPKDP